MEKPDNPNKKLELVIKDSNLNPRQNILDNGILFDHLEKNKNIKKYTVLINLHMIPYFVD